MLAEQPSTEEEKDWIVFLRPGCTYADIKALCDKFGKHHPDEGVEMRKRSPYAGSPSDMAVVRTSVSSSALWSSVWRSP